MDHKRHLHVPILDLRCGSSERARLERALGATDGVLSAYVNPTTDTAYLVVDGAEVDAWAIVRVISKAGFTAGRPVEG